jgi:ACS family glucarate transporter-like MFS transporter
MDSEMIEKNPIDQALPQNVKWRVLTILTLVSMVSLIERCNLTVIARFVRDEFHLTNIEVGHGFTAFLVCYAVGQIPAGLLVDRFGAKRVLLASVTVWALSTSLFSLLLSGHARSGTTVVLGLILFRSVLGFAEASTFPAAAYAIREWFPKRQYGIANSALLSASFAGEAIAIAVLVWLIELVGWRWSLFLSVTPAVALGFAIWLSYPSTAPKASETENEAHAPDPLRRMRMTYLSIGYFFHEYVTYTFVFWFYIYLVDVRGYKELTNWVAALPTIAAALAALGVGMWADRWARRWGRGRASLSLIALSGVGGGIALAVGALVQNPIVSVGGFVLAMGSRGMADAVFWSYLIHVGGGKVGKMGGVMNMVGNLGGVASTIAAPLMSAYLGWTPALLLAALFAMFTALPAIANWRDAADHQIS